MQACQCSYCVNPLRFVWLENGKLMPKETPYFRFPVRIRARIGTHNIVAVLDASDIIRFADNSVIVSWEEATKHAYRQAGCFGPGRRNNVDEWLPNGWNPKRIWSINILGFGSVTLDQIDMVNKFSGNAQKRLEHDASPCTDMGEVNYELKNNMLCGYPKTLRMFAPGVRAELTKERSVMIPTLEQAAPESVPSRRATKKKHAQSARLSSKQQKTARETSDDDCDHEEESFEWLIDAPVKDWTSYNVTKYIQQRDSIKPVLVAVDRTFLRYGAMIEFMEVRMQHPPTASDVKVTLSSALLYHVSVYQERIKTALAEFRSQN